MNCPSCHSPLQYQTHFCPNCGFRLSADAHAESPVPLPETGPQHPTDGSNVVYLDGSHGAGAPEPIPLHPGIDPHGAPTYPAGGHPHPVGVPQHPVGVPQPQGDVQYTQNVLGELIPVTGALAAAESGAPEASRHEVRLLGGLVVFLASAALFTACVLYAIAIARGYKYANAGGFVLLSLFIWWAYVDVLSADQHLPSVTRRLDRFNDRWDTRFARIHSSAERTVQVRKEQERFGRIQNERNRRISELGEQAYREYRAGRLPVQLGDAAQRVWSMEQQMLMADKSLQDLRGNGLDDRVVDPELPASDSGHEPDPSP